MFKKYGLEWPLYREAEVCIWCGNNFIEESKYWVKSKEHVAPLSQREAKKSRRGISASHRYCNSVRGDNNKWVPYYVEHKMTFAQCKHTRVVIFKLYSGIGV